MYQMVAHLNHTKKCSADDINGELEWCWDQSLMLDWYLNGRW